MQRFSGKIRGIGNKQADGNLDGAVVNTMFEPLRKARENQTHHHADGDEISETADSGAKGRVLAVHHHGSREFQSEQSGGVVEQTLAFENVDDALRQADALGDGGGGDGVGGGNHGAQDKTDAPIETHENPGDRGGDAEHCECHQADGQGGDAGQVISEFAPRGKPRSGI